MRSFDFQPTLTGQLVQLRPLMNEDFEELYLCASDPKVWEQHPQRNRYENAVFKKFFNCAIESRSAFAIIDLMNKKIIGSSRFYNLDNTQSQITVGYTFLKTECWGGRYNRDVKSLMLNHAFISVDLVTFEIGAHNIRSRRAIEKIGAWPIKNEDLDGQLHIVYGIDKPKLMAAISLFI